jgi:Transposase zinc-binding domain
MNASPVGTARLSLTTACRNRHCPKCQASARHRWLEASRQELLPTRYVHIVFTLAHELASLALQNKKILYHLLLQTSAATLLEVARDPKHLGAEIGFFGVLHTWNQKLPPCRTSLPVRRSLSMTLRTAHRSNLYDESSKVREQ